MYNYLSGVNTNHSSSLLLTDPIQCMAEAVGRGDASEGKTTGHVCSNENRRHTLVQCSHVTGFLPTLPAGSAGLLLNTKNLIWSDC